MKLGCTPTSFWLCLSLSTSFLLGERLCEEVHYCCGWPYSGIAASVPTKGPQLSPSGPTGSLEKGNMAQKGPVSTSYEIIIFVSRYNAPITRHSDDAVPPTTQPSASVDGCECLSPHQHAILRGRACARWLISTEDTLPPFLLLSLMLFSSSSCLLRVHFIYHSFLDSAPGFLLQPCPNILYTIQAAHLESCRAEPCILK